MEAIINTIVGYIWSDALVYLALGVGIYFTIMTRGVQFRYLKEMIKLLFDKQTSAQGISSFQAFSMALSGRIGVGNIAGVATAIAAGGPGAVFWMIVMGLLGGASAFIESTLAQVYKHTVDDQYRGGSPFYIERGLKMKPFALVVAAVTCLSYGVLVPGVQANTIADSFNTAFNLPPYGNWYHYRSTASLYYLWRYQTYCKLCWYCSAFYGDWLYFAHGCRLRF